MLDSNDLVKTIKTVAIEAMAANKPMQLVFGTVMEENPLKINVEQKMLLDNEFLIVPQHLTDYKIRVGVNWQVETDTMQYSHTHVSNVNVSFVENQKNQSETSTEKNGEPEHMHDVKYTHDVNLNLNGNFSATVATDTLNYSHSHGMSGKREMTIYNALKKGEEVILIQKQGGQQYIVLDRVVKQ